MTGNIYATDAYARQVTASVVEVDADDGRVLLDKTVFYPGGGGQPHDLGFLSIGSSEGDDRLAVVRVTADRDKVWHWLEGGIPPRGSTVDATIDWDRRYALMRTHTAMHALCGVIWDRFRSPVTGGDMKPGQGRLDFELPDWNAEFKLEVEAELNRQLELRRRVDVSFLPRSEADEDPSLIRTKVSLLPAELEEVRVIDIVGLDRQADGGTHVHNTEEVGVVTVGKVESKGRGFRRIRVEINELLKPVS
ncbi:MAG: alanyl-tRNA editing protein [Acidimicrobiia bacterium]|nr:alanyl-tRNA editing protein [Acidimicrobiia bacterium]NNC43956.1 alanyl-tRNA editing protein [Acidimicrobiia bacterium]NND12615.1 alanyl-tRNA editing protein [Acidimicrobiia bacterium]NNL27399.1 alanyl-tRNA editing protein [Acidimicrobiia bacterium]